MELTKHGVDRKLQSTGTKILKRYPRKKMPYGCLSVELEYQRHEAEACYEDFLEHAENNLEIAYLARILQEKCLSCKNLAG